MLKKFTDLTFSDDFIFGKVLTKDMELTRELLELLLNKPIKEVKLSEAQKSLKETYTSKGIRLDVYVKDADNTVYDVEMQTTLAKDLSKRMRYYQDIIDLNLIESGSKYADLRESYIIFICLQDPFFKNLPVYTFRNVCKEAPGLLLNDATTKVVINVSGKKDGLSDKMKALFYFLENQIATDDFTPKIANKVEEAKSSSTLEVDYMSISSMIMEQRWEGEQIGMQKGIQETIKKMVTGLRKTCMEDTEIVNFLLENYNLSISEAQEYLNITKNK